MVDRAFKDNSVNVVFCAGNNYLKYTAVALMSLIENSDKNRNYDIVILETNNEENAKDLISDMVKDCKNFSVRFFNISEYFDKYRSENMVSHHYYSKEIFMRIFIPDILTNYDKVIYLDSDIIVTTDIGKLFDMDLEGNYLGAVRDFNSITNMQYMPEMRSYFKEFLGIEKMGLYFNSGVLLMDLNLLREIKLVQKSMDLLKRFDSLKYPDQDILNIICTDNHLLIDGSWNFTFAINAILVQNSALRDFALDWCKGLITPNIIHYITEFKPWNTPMSYSDVWWIYAAKTPFFEKLKEEFNIALASGHYGNILNV